MREARRLVSAILATAALAVVAGCGDDDEDSAKTTNTTATERADASPLKCLSESVLPPHLYERGQTKGVEKGVKPLLTKGARGGEILTGVLGAVVIEYPEEAGAKAALERARASRVLTAYVAPERIVTFGRLLFIDYSNQGYVRRMARGCGLRPDQPAPTP